MQASKAQGKQCISEEEKSVMTSTDNLFMEQPETLENMVP